MSVKFETKKVPMETLGEYLSEIRNQLNLTLEEVAQKTGLYEKFIYYIEQGKYQLLPPDVYVLGFLKKLAAVYQISCESLIEQYKKERGIVENVAHEKIAPTKGWRSWLQKVTITPRLLTISGSVALSVIAFFYVVVQVFAINKTPSLEIMEPKNDAVISGTSVSVSGKTEPGIVIAINGQNVFVQNDGTFHTTLGVAPGQKELKIDALNKFGKQTTKMLSMRVEEPKVAGAETEVPSLLQLELHFSKATKISMIRDGIQIPDEVVPAQGVKTVVADNKVILTTSDAGSTSVFLNGKSLGVLGSIGQILTVPFTKEAGSLVAPLPNPTPTTTTPVKKTPTKQTTTSKSTNSNTNTTNTNTNTFR